MAASITRGKTFGASEEVTNTKLHTLVDSATIANIDQTNMAASSGILVTSGSNPSDTDALWRDTGNSNVIKYYDGTSWTRISPATTISTLDVVTTETTVAQSSTSEETLHSFSVPANTIGADGMLRIKMWFDGLQNSGGAVSFTFRLKYGATTMASFAVSTNAHADRFDGMFDAYLKGDGTTGTQEAAFTLIGYETAGGAFGNQIPRAFDSGTASEDSTGALNLVLTVQSDTNNANIEFVLKAISIEKLEAV